MPSASVTLGYQALQINVLEQFGSGSFVTVANFISPVLITNAIQASTWQFIIYVNNIQKDAADTTTSSFIFGTSQYRSGVSNIMFSTPSRSEISWFRLNSGDIIGFIIGSFYDVLGSATYAIILFGVCASMYRRYSHFGTIAFYFILFGGSGGIILLFIPLWAIAPFAALMIIGCGWLLWRILR